MRLRTLLFLSLAPLVACVGGPDTDATSPELQVTTNINPGMGTGLPSATLTISGKLEFDADFPTKNQVGDIPIGRSPLPYLYVCAWDQEGSAVDWQYTDYPLTAPLGNDRLLGCARADASGNYSIGISSILIDLPDIYLSTRLCDGPDGGDFSTADVCVRINADEVDANEPANVKAIWSRVYANQPKTGTVQISWNLSCPNQAGLGLASVACLVDQPADWGDCSCGTEAWKACARTGTGTNGDTNSRYGCNKEAVETYRAAIQSYNRWGTNKPTASSTFGKDCDDKYDLNNAYDYCAFGDCQDEVNFHLAAVTRAGTATHGSCDPAWNNKNGAASFDDVCVGTPDEPFRVVHELGHVVDMRWRCSGMGSPSIGDLDRKETREGWADFVAVAAWFAPNAAYPVFAHDGFTPDAEIGYAAYDPKNIDWRETNVMRFFVDLHDDPNSREAETEDWAFSKIRNIWSKFPAGTGTHQVDSVESDVLDYLYWWNDEHGPIVGSDVCTYLVPDYHIIDDFLTPADDSPRCVP